MKGLGEKVDKIDENIGLLRSESRENGSQTKNSLGELGENLKMLQKVQSTIEKN